MRVTEIREKPTTKYAEQKMQMDGQVQ